MPPAGSSTPHLLIKAVTVPPVPLLICLLYLLLFASCTSCYLPSVPHVICLTPILYPQCAEHGAARFDHAQNIKLWKTACHTNSLPFESFEPFAPHLLAVGLALCLKLLGVNSRGACCTESHALLEAMHTRTASATVVHSSTATVLELLGATVIIKDTLRLVLVIQKF